MPLEICSKCQCAYQCGPGTTGVTVIEYADFGPYKVWSADERVCPGCGSKIITGFGNRELYSHFQPEFNAYIERVESNYPGSIRNWYPKPVKVTSEQDMEWVQDSHKEELHDEDCECDDCMREGGCVTEEPNPYSNCDLY